MEKLLFLRLAKDHHHHMLVEELRGTFPARDDLSECVAPGDRYIQAECCLDGKNIRAGLGFEEHLPGNIRQD